jgi:hypothetical protein
MDKIKFSRQKYNEMILSVITEAVHNEPDLRFGQILANLNIIKYEKYRADPNITLITKDPFYEESEETYNKLRK